MRTVVAIAALLLATLPRAYADESVDPVPDRIGVYFDVEASANVAWFGPLANVTMYIILTNPSFENIYGWQAAIRGVDPEALHVLNTTITGGSVITGADLQFDVTLETPLVAAPVTVLAAVSGFMWVGNPMVCMSLTGIDDPAIQDTLPLVFAQQDLPTAIQVAQYYENGIVAAINESQHLAGPDCADLVGVERISWSAVKSSYR
jgi:hypothetical protein